MKTNSFILKMEKPCSINLSAMEKHDVGLYCTHCEKNVIDFSRLSDEEVISIVEKFNGNLCGRFTKSQLERVFTATHKRQDSPRLNKILAGIFALGMLESAQVDAKEISKTEIVQTENNSVGNNFENAFQKSENAGDTTKNTISGTILNANTQKPIPYVDVMIEGSNIATKSDSSGKFTLVIPEKYLTDSVTIQFSAPVYYRVVKFGKTELPANRTILLTEEIIIEGGIHSELVPNSLYPLKTNKKRNRQ